MGDVGIFGELEYKVVSNHAGRSYGKQENGSRGVREERKLSMMLCYCCQPYHRNTALTGRRTRFDLFTFLIERASAHAVR